MTDTVPIVDAPGLAQLHRDLHRHSVDVGAHEGIEGPPAQLAPDLDEFLAGEDPDYDWLVPQLIEKRDRTILTGPEGQGKSTLLRQFGLQAASGIHPFTLEPMEPRRVLLIDCENSAKQLRRKLGPLRQAAADAYRTGHFRVRVAPNGVDLLINEHRQHFIDVVTANRPELLIVGPIYKMASGDPVKEEPAREVSRVLDWLRHEHDVALLIEAHSPYPSNGNARPQRPYGASLWSRWPEFGLYLGLDGTLGHWRGDRDERDWPARLTRSEPWPWTVAGDTTEEWDGPTHCVEAALALLREIAPEELTVGVVVKRLKERGQGFRNQTVGSALRIATENGDLTIRKGPRGATLYSFTAGATLLDSRREDVEF